MVTGFLPTFGLANDQELAFSHSILSLERVVPVTF
jgi:hypothetical protein